MDSKLIGVLKSRKFWAGVIGILVAVGLLNFGEGDESRLTEAILTVVTTVSYIVATAIEDAGKAQGIGMANAPTNVISTGTVKVGTQTVAGTELEDMDD